MANLLRRLSSTPPVGEATCGAKCGDLGAAVTAVVSGDPDESLTREAKSFQQRKTTGPLSSLHVSYVVSNGSSLRGADGDFRLWAIG